MSEHKEPNALEDIESLQLTSGTSGFVEKLTSGTKAGRNFFEHSGLGTINKYAAPLGLLGGINNMFNGHSTLQRVQGGMETFSSTVELTEMLAHVSKIPGLHHAMKFLGPAGMVVGAGAAGIEAGTHGNESAREYGFLGKNEFGENRNWSDVVRETAENPLTASHTGEALAVAGVGAAATTAYDFGGAIGAYPNVLKMKAELEKEQREQEAANYSSSKSYANLLTAGASASTAANIAGIANPEFREQANIENNTQGTYASARKAGLSPEAAANIARLANPAWRGPAK